VARRIVYLRRQEYADSEVPKLLMPHITTIVLGEGEGISVASSAVSSIFARERPAF